MNADESQLAEQMTAAGVPADDAVRGRLLKLPVSAFTKTSVRRLREELAAARADRGRRAATSERQTWERELAELEKEYAVFLKKN